ncbi:DUF2786 domain-containing protein [Nitrolancea hollandica]|uniref:Uncharacterized protein n=1 Tax=Nitrolancea hollandica Lb TaxID=1129897 RepID=I4EL29_9BACT|nr:DUF2786 domain-containing protein [Nitrolancea hollandica]CCF85391.1 hypothetical protein NITHO_4920002 [Nitrolancea hollandica Lb]
MASAITDDIIKRIQKVAALADSPNVNEAAVAAAKLQELLFRHNLTMAEIHAKSGKLPGSDYGKHEYYVGRNHGYGWKRRLMGAIARYNFCHAVSHRGDDQMFVVGEEHNVTVVFHLYEFLEAEIRRLATAGYRDYRLRVWSPRYALTPSKWKTSFYHGAVETIGDRLREQYLANRGDDRQTHALVRAKDAELAKAVYDFFGQLGKLKVNTGESADGYAAGQEAAQGINLSPQVRSGSRYSGPRALGAGR